MNELIEKGFGWLLGGCALGGFSIVNLIHLILKTF